jgi:hypothetical protein
VNKLLVSVVIVSSLGLLGCNVEPVGEGELSQSSEALTLTLTPTTTTTTTTTYTISSTIPPMPKTPEAPIELYKIPWGTPLYPVTAASAHTVVYPHPTEFGRWVAYGWDVTREVNYFFITGTLKEDYRRFTSQIAADIFNIETSSTRFLDFGASSVGYFVIGPGPGPGPGITPVPDVKAAWEQAWRTKRALDLARESASR